MCVHATNDIKTDLFQSQLESEFVIRNIWTKLIIYRVSVSVHYLLMDSCSPVTLGFNFWHLLKLTSCTNQIWTMSNQLWFFFFRLFILEGGEGCSRIILYISHWLHVTERYEFYLYNSPFFQWKSLFHTDLSHILF